MPMVQSIEDALRTLDYKNERHYQDTRRAAAVMLNTFYLNKHRPFNEFVPVSRAYKRKVFGNHYNQVWTPLEKLLFETKKFEFGEYSKKREVCKHFRFKREFITGSLELMKFQEKESKRFSGDFVTKRTVSLLQELTLTLPTKKAIRDYLKRLPDVQGEDGRSIRDKIRQGVKTGAEIESHFVRISGTGKKRKLTTVLEEINHTNLTLVEYTWRKKSRWYLEEKFNLEKFVEERVQDAVKAYESALLKLHAIKDRANVDCDRNRTNFRLDTNLTNLLSSILELVRLDGEKLVSIDISNSQPLLLSHVLFSNFYRCKFAAKAKASNNPHQIIISDLFQTLNLFIKTLSTNTPPNPSPPLCLKTLKKSTNTGVPADKVAYRDTSSELFRDAAENGKIYEAVAARIFQDESKGYDYRKVTKEQRSFVKTAMFQIMFDTPKNTSKEKEIFSKDFAAVVALVDGFKEYLYRTKYLSEERTLGRLAVAKKYGAHWKRQSFSKIEKMVGAKKFKAICSEAFREKYEVSAYKYASNQLAVGLQALEAAIMIDAILAKLLRKGYKVFSKHDSILCKESDAPEVLELVKAELDKVFGADGYALKIEG